MEKIEINGGFPLEGEVKISGAKNAALPIMAACLLAPGRSLIHNVPNLKDVRSMIEILRHLGARAEFAGKTTLSVDCSKLSGHHAPYELVSVMRASILVLGALLGRLGRAEVSMPGGCVIGIRPIDLHLAGLKNLNARVEIEHGYIRASAPELVGNEIFIGGRFGSSVGATINILLASVKARGKTVLVNAACEPEVVDTVEFLRAMGAQIEGGGSPCLTVTGVDELSPAEHEIIPDRIEAGTYLVAGALAGGKVVVAGARSDHLNALINIFSRCGVEIKKSGTSIEVTGGEGLKSVDITTQTYPGFPTDMQAQMMTLLALTPGISLITEKIYPERFMHIPELNRLGARITLEGSTAIVRGVGKLSGAPVMAADLRASSALVLAGLVARGTTVVDRVYHLDRGYERMEEKLKALGARIERVAD